MSGHGAADLLIEAAAVRCPIQGATSVAVRGERIEAVGTRDEVAAVLGPKTEVIGVPEGLVVPGFQDAHAHPAESGVDRMRCDLTGIEDAGGYREAIARYAAGHPDEPWILGSGWSMAAFPGGIARREQLDDIVPDRPVFLPNRDGHGTWVNSKALELAGVDAGTPDPEDGRIERDPATGEPVGTLHEGARTLVERLIPEPTEADWLAGILEGQRYLHSLGITAWQDAIVTAPILGAYRSLASRGELTARVEAALWWDRARGDEQIGELRELRRHSGGRLRADTVKMMLDGVAENFTARMLHPYLDAGGNPTDNLGIAFVDPDLLPGHVVALDREGFQVHFHAIGDGAVRYALDAVEAAVAANGTRDARHHIAHIQVVHPEDVHRFSRLGVVANAQPLWASHDPQMDELTIPFLGPERAASQYPFGSLLRAGARLAFGSDWAVSSPDPFLQMEVAVTRVDPGDRGAEPLLPDERITLDQALDAFTEGSAFVNRLDDLTGRLRPGMLADLVVVDRDITAEGAGPIGDASAALTMVGGRVVHDVT